MGGIKVAAFRGRPTLDQWRAGMSRTFVIVAGVFLLGPSPSAPIPEEAPRAAAFPVAGTTRGDINGDGVTTALDALGILAAVVGRTLPEGFTAYPNGDVNCDESLTALDALITLSAVVGKDVSAFCYGEALIASVEVQPDTVALAVGAQIQLTATVKDGNDSTVTDASVSWTSSDTAVATVSDSGLVAAVGTGLVTISATTGGVSGTATLGVTTGGTSRRWVGGATGAATDWSSAYNWVPAGAPSMADSMVVPGGAAQMPMLTADAQVSWVEVESGGTLDLGAFQLTATGGVRSAGEVKGSGVLVLAGAQASLEGTVPSVRVTSTTTLAGETTVGGVLQIVGGLWRQAGKLLRVIVN